MRDPLKAKARAARYRATPKAKATQRRWREGHRAQLRLADQARRAQRAALALARYPKQMAIINAAKSWPCMDCGGVFPPECMDFDHARGPKYRGVSAMAGYSPARIHAEIAKCDVVCANCHRIRTTARLRAAV